MTSHPLDPLLRPASLALVGASPRPESSGHAMVAMARIDGYAGAVHPINPRYEEIEGLRCYPSLADLPQPPDHVAIGVAGAMVEGVLDQAIATGARAATIFSACHVEGDPGLAARLAAKARGAGMALCGANCMGFYNPAAGLRVASFPSPPGLRRGGIAWIAQSGSAFGALAHNDRRLGFGLCVSTGMELVTTVADYVDWALDQPGIRVIGLFLESVRNPPAFVRALEKAAARGIPVAALKIGRTEKSAAMAMSHTGAIAGDDAAHDALFRRHGVTRVHDFDEMAAVLALLDSDRRAGPGGLGCVHDSGGEREMAADLADDLGLSYPALSEATVAALAEHLEPGLTPENPLDAFGTATDYVPRYAALIAALVEDPAIALGLYLSDPRDGYWYTRGYTDALIEASRRTAKPLAMVSNYGLVQDGETAGRLGAAGIPLIRGTRNALLAARHVLAWRDFRARPRPAPPLVPAGAAARWAQRLARAPRPGEAEGLAMLADFGLNVPQMRAVAGPQDLEAALADLPLPVALKTAEDIAHKSDVGGVVLGLSTPAQLRDAYAAMAARLGPRALIAQMIPRGVEIGLGAVRDPAFGPVVVVGAGGVLIEVLRDRVAALAPFDAAEAERLLSGLRLAPLLAGVRGAPPVDIGALAEQVAAFSAMVAALDGALAEIDVNPLIATPSGTWAADCLVIAAPPPG